MKRLSEVESVRARDRGQRSLSVVSSGPSCSTSGLVELVLSPLGEPGTAAVSVFREALAARFSVSAVD